MTHATDALTTARLAHLRSSVGAMREQLAKMHLGHVLERSELEDAIEEQEAEIRQIEGEKR